MHNLDRKPPLPGFDFDAEQGLLRDARGTEVPLRPQTTAVLQQLWTHAGRVVSKTELMDSVWRDVVVTDDSLVQCIKEIRQALGDDEHRIVRTLPRRGYRLVLAQAAGVPAQRDGAAPPRRPALCFGRAEIQPTERHLLLDGQRAVLGEAAFDVLLALAERRARVVSRNELLDLVWPHQAVAEGELQAQLAVLRKLLGPDVISTVPGRGYRFSAVVLDEPQTTTQEDRSSPALPSAPAQNGPNDPNGADQHPSELHRFDTHLPDTLPPLIGRDGDLDSLDTMVRKHPLVTITGAGGMGKTRLAQHLLKRQQGEYEQGVCWVELAGLSDPTLVAPTIASALGVQIGSGDPLKGLVAVLRDMSVLLALDNAEHLVDEVARVAPCLAEAGPQVRVLVTSQAPLRCRGEWIFHLESLATPKVEATVDEAIAFGAVALFVERAQAADRYFELTAGNVATAVELCRRLDGLPLAIELAAARVPHLGLATLASSLNERLGLLTNGKRDAPARQQALRAALEWSHSLLTDVERAVLRRLSVFAGSFRLEVAQQVVVSTEFDEWAALDALGALVDKSFVQVERFDTPRYRVLDTVRIFASEQLAQYGEVIDAQQRHGQSMAYVAEDAEATFWELADTPWWSRFAPDMDDVEVAFWRACGWQDAGVVTTTGQLLAHRDYLGTSAALSAMRRRAEAACALLPLAHPRARAIIWNWMALCWPQVACGVPRVTAAREAVSAWRQLDDLRQLYLALGRLAFESASVGEMEAAVSALDEGRNIEDEAWPPRLCLAFAALASGVSERRGDAQAHRIDLRCELELAELAGADLAAAFARFRLADAASASGDFEEAVTLGRAAVAEQRSLVRQSVLHLALGNLCGALLVRGDVEAAAAAALEAWPIALKESAGFLLDHVGLLATQVGRCVDAARILGRADAWYRASHIDRFPNDERSAQLAREAIEAALEPAARMREFIAGENLTDGQIDALVREVLSRAARRELEA